MFDDVPFESAPLAALRVRFDVDDVRFEALRPAPMAIETGVSLSSLS